MNRKRRVIRVLSLAAVIVLGSIMLSGVAEAADNGDRKVDVKRTEKTISFKVSIKKMGDSPERGVNAIATDPPGGGCEGIIQFNTTAYYVQKILVDTVTPYYGNVHCTTTAGDQFMAEMSILSDLRIDGGVLHTANFGICYDCLNVTSTAKASCYQAIQKCFGRYTARAVITMLLPDDWIWTGPPADVCTLTGPPEAYCTLDSSPADIPYVYPG